jgi:large subunit ribosomal protein L29
MQASELRELSDAELVEKLDEFKEELFNLRFQNVTGQLDNPNRLRRSAATSPGC